MSNSQTVGPRRGFLRKQATNGKPVRLVGISGRKGAGKDTVAKYLSDKHPNAIRVAFADELKILAMRYFGLSWSDVNGTQEQKAAQCPSCKPGVSVRNVLQTIGQSWRDLSPDIWVRNMARTVEAIRSVSADDTLIIIPDVRYPDEVRAIQQWGGLVIRLNRIPFPDSHESETALDGFDGFDALIFNDRQTLTETLEIADFIARAWGVL